MDHRRTFLNMRRHLKSYHVFDRSYFVHLISPNVHIMHPLFGIKSEKQCTYLTNIS